MAHAHGIIIYHGVGALRHGQEIVDDINANEKLFVYMLMENLKWPGSKGYVNKISMDNTTQK